MKKIECEIFYTPINLSQLSLQPMDESPRPMLEYQGSQKVEYTEPPGTFGCMMFILAPSIWIAHLIFTVGMAYALKSVILAKDISWVNVGSIPLILFEMKTGIDLGIFIFPLQSILPCYFATQIACRKYMLQHPKEHQRDWVYWMFLILWFIWFPVPEKYSMISGL